MSLLALFIKVSDTVTRFPSHAPNEALVSPLLTLGYTQLASPVHATPEKKGKTHPASRTATQLFFRFDKQVLLFQRIYIQKKQERGEGGRNSFIYGHEEFVLIFLLLCLLLWLCCSFHAALMLPTADMYMRYVSYMYLPKLQQSSVECNLDAFLNLKFTRIQHL